MQLRPEFTRLIEGCARVYGVSPEKKSVDETQALPAALDRVDAADFEKAARSLSCLTTLKSSLKTGLGNGTFTSEMSPKGHEMITQFASSVDKMPGVQSAQRILSQVQGALGGLPVSFAKVDSLPASGLSWAYYSQVDAKDGTFVASNQDRADGVVYIDHQNEQLLIDSQPYYISLPHQ